MSDLNRGIEPAGTQHKASNPGKADVASVDIAEVEAALSRVRNQLGDADYELFQRLVNTLRAVTAILHSKQAMLARLRRLFGLKSSERSRDVLKQAPKQQGQASTDDAGTDASESADSSPGATQSESADHAKPTRKGHGRLPESMYKSASHIAVPHATLAVGGACPCCPSGRLFELKEPAKYLRIFGQPVFAGTCWDCQRLRCSSCGRVHTAQPPPEAQGPKFDDSAVAMLALCRYGLGLPHHRLEHMQRHMHTPVPASTQWDVIYERAPAVEPVFAHLEHLAAQAQVIHNDDTYGRVLAFMGERRAKLLMAAQLPDPHRVGLFTTAIVSLLDEKPIILFYTGRKYAGENLAELLRARTQDLEPPIHMCDGLDSRNAPTGHVVVGANCLAHGRRGVVDQVVNFPSECRFILEILQEVYRVDAWCKKQGLSPEQRLRAHQEQSAPCMQRLHARIKDELDNKRVEPNSGLGKAYTYLLKRWDRLTLFLRKAGAPIDNNICERALKKAIRHRRNSLFYRSERGAEIGDMFMSIIHTAEAHGQNPFEYIQAILRNERAVADNPADWMPWNYQRTLSRLSGTLTH